MGDGLDHRRVAELATQPADRHLDNVAERARVLVPATTEKLVRGNGRAVCGEQELEHRQLFRAELEPAAGSTCCSLCGVETDVAFHERRRKRALVASRERADACDDLGERERLWG